MKQSGNFQNLIKRCLDENTESIDTLKITTVQLIRHWSLKNKIELSWVADPYRMVKETDFLIACFDRGQYEIRSGHKVVKSFQNYKEVIIQITEEEISVAFGKFFCLLKKGNDVAWSVLHKSLFCRSYSWLKSKGVQEGDEMKTIFNDSMGRFYEKMVSNDLKFDQSLNLKSYFFRILELRSMEAHREKKKQNFLELDHSEVLKLPFEHNYALFIEGDEEHRRMHGALNRLTDTERIILTGFYFEKYNLREIADQIGKSEENVRVIKHRALKKLMIELKTREIA